MVVNNGMGWMVLDTILFHPFLKIPNNGTLFKINECLVLV